MVLPGFRPPLLLGAAYGAERGEMGLKSLNGNVKAPVSEIFWRRGVFFSFQGGKTAYIAVSDVQSTCLWPDWVVKQRRPRRLLGAMGAYASGA